jgi:transposase-like protein
MSPRARDERFACPFCRSASVVLIGRGGQFVHYRCAACAEVWTGMKFPEPAHNWTADRSAAPKTARRH